jgi:hypothetical protein
MSVLQLGTAATDKLFMEYIKPGLQLEFVKNTVVYDRFKTDKEACQGKYGVMRLMTAAAKSARPSSSSSFPTPKQGTYSEFLFYIKRGMYASMQFDGLAIACGKGAGAIKDIIKAETEGITIYIANRLNRQFWGNGSGVLAVVNGAVSASTSVTIDHAWFGVDANGYTPASRYLEAGQSVDIYSSAGVLQESDVEISTITLGGGATDTLTMGSNVTCSDNSVILDHDTYATTEAAGTGVPMGLMGIISTSNQTVGITALSAFQNIDRSSYTFAQAQLFNHSSAAITNKRILEAIQKVEKYGTVNVILTNGEIWRAYYEQLEADKTLPNEKAFWGGTSGLTFYGGRSKALPIIYDDDCPDNRIFFIDDTKIKVIAPTDSGMDWLPGDSGHILTRVAGKDEYTANLRWYYNMSCTMPQAEGCIYGVKHAAS